MDNITKEKQKKIEQDKLLHQMEIEIKKLEKQIKYHRIIDIKIGAIKNLKITARALQMVAPYVVTAGITAGVFTAIGNCPFYCDTIQHNSHNMKEFDSLGNVRYEQQYDEFDNDINILSLYTKWEPSNNGFFVRTVEQYKVKELTEEEVLEIFEKFENKEITIQDIFGEPISSIKESKNNLSSEEIEMGNYFQAVLYSEDEGDFILIKESIGDNVAVLLGYILVTFFAELVPFFIRSEISSFDFSDCVEEIKRNQKNFNIDTVRKKLEIKRDNFNRLMR